MTTIETQEIVKQLCNETFVALGGYSELSKYMTFETIARAVFFPGQTLFMSILSSDENSLLSFDLQPYGYIPQTPLIVLSEHFKPVYSRTLPPLSINGKTVYLFGTTPEEKSILYFKHLNRLLFNFSTFNFSNTIQVFGLTRYPQSVYDSVIDSYRNIRRSSIKEIYTDNIYIQFSQPILHLFSCPPSQPLTSLFSPTNQSSSSTQLIVSTSSPLTFCVCSILSSPYNNLIGLTESQLSSTLSSTHQKIYFDNISQSHYWLSNDFSYRLSISFAGPTVYSSTKESFTLLPISILNSIGDLSRLVNKNNIYNLKPYSNSFPRLDITSQV